MSGRKRGFVGVCSPTVQLQLFPASSLRNRPPQQSDSRPAQSSSGYRGDYEQYSQYQQQMYPGYYSSWGFEQAGYPYGCQLYDYSQYPAAQVGWSGGGGDWPPRQAALLTLSLSS